MVTTTEKLRNFDFGAFKPQIPYLFLNRPKFKIGEELAIPKEPRSKNLSYSVHKLHEDISNSKLDRFAQLVEYGNSEVVRKFSRFYDLEKQYNYDGFKGITALGIAACNNNIEMIDTLLEAGADINGGETCAEEVAFCIQEDASEALCHILDLKESMKLKTYVEKISSLT